MWTDLLIDVNFHDALYIPSPDGFLELPEENNVLMG